MGSDPQGLTPPNCEYRPGGPQPSYDKQPLRDYLDLEISVG
jgi:hypothetical protein